MTLDESRTLLDPLFTGGKMRRIFSDRARLQSLLNFEAALASAEARIGVIPSASATAIAARCKAETFDLASLSRDAVPAGNLVIPLVKALTALVAQDDPKAADFVHFGTTSQDAIDTGLILQLHAALDAIESDLGHLSDTLAKLVAEHEYTLLAGRTLLQQALPITFAMKAAGWLSAAERHRARLREVRTRVLVVQFGGAAGTLAALGTRGLDVAQALAEELGLALPDMPWHSHRDRMVEVATALGLLVGTLGKMARDISLLMQSEVGEASEPAAAGRGGSSAMPHKRNPVGCAAVLANATRMPALVATMLAAMVQEHERGLGGWQAEWETLPDVCLLAGGALERMIEVIDGLEIDPARMRENLADSQGLVHAEAITMALANHLGRGEAFQRVEQACRLAVLERRPLREVLEKDSAVAAHLSKQELDRLFDPAHNTGMSQALVQRVLSRRSKQ